jgi:hypothetical protein
MGDLSRIHPHYRGMIETMTNRTDHEGDLTATQEALGEMPDGARWSHDVSHRVYRAGGNEGEFTEAALESEAGASVEGSWGPAE